MKTILFVLLLLIVNTLSAENNYSTKSNWLVDTKTDESKFKKIQEQFRGFDLAMVEVGYRFNGFYFAIEDKNYDLAQYQLDKIKKAIENGVKRRPKRTTNSQLMFLNNHYRNMSDALNSKDSEQIKSQYLNTKNLCNACHYAEKVPFIEVVDPTHRWLPIK